MLQTASLLDVSIYLGHSNALPTRAYVQLQLPCGGGMAQASSSCPVLAASILTINLLSYGGSGPSYHYIHLERTADERCR
jgi:hypothetical protein